MNLQETNQVRPRQSSQAAPDGLARAHVAAHSVMQYAVHTSAGCTVDNSTSANAEGTLLYGNCDANVNFNSGCTYRDPRTSSYGAGLAAAGGGVYAAQLSTDGFSMWFFPRAEVPADLASTDFSTVPTPDSWGTPAAYYPASSCTPADHFSPLKMVFTATACGDWAGQPAVLSQTGCPLANDQMTCYTQYVLK